MLNMNLLHGAVLALAAAAAGFAGTPASAGGCYSGGYYYGGGHGGYVSVNVGYHSRGHYDRSHRRGGYHHGDRGSRHCDTPRHRGHVQVRHHHHEPAGYYRRVYHPPVYRTYYDACGYPYRVCVRAGYYERVWVPGCR
jgi:hypothetical protein